MMDTKVSPQVPCQRADDAMMRLAQFREIREGKGEKAGRSGASNVMFILAAILSFVGSVLLVCTLLVMCAPDSGASRAIFDICKALP